MGGAFRRCFPLSQVGLREPKGAAQTPVLELQGVSPQYPTTVQNKSIFVSTVALGQTQQSCSFHPRKTWLVTSGIL